MMEDFPSICHKVAFGIVGGVDVEENLQNKKPTWHNFKDDPYWWKVIFLCEFKPEFQDNIRNQSN